MNLQLIKKIMSISLLFTSTLFAQKKIDKNVADKNTKTLIVFFDGLRPDYITPELMPNLYAFKQQSSYGNQHHSVFPTVTRVNSSSYSSGSYPATNGIMGNTVYFPQVNRTKGLNTGEAEELNKINVATGGNLLTAITLGEVLEAAGKNMWVFSSGSTGQALLQNHKVGSGAIVNTGLILPASLKEKIVAEIGAIPPHTKPNTAQHKWITDAIIKYGLPATGPAVNAIWYSDPDGTAHSDGIGSATANESIKTVDREFGRILKAIDSSGLKNKTNILISTDHGFVTHIGKENITEILINAGIKKDKESDDVVLSEGAIYVKDHNEVVIQQIVTLLQSKEWVGAIFTKSAKSGDTKGHIAGTLSFESIHWNHPERAADILIDVNWNDSKNTTGYAGTSFARGVAGHGSLSAYEVHIGLIAGGPAFKQSYISEIPTSNVDIAPTILQLYGLTIPASMDGRAVSELFVGNKNKVAVSNKQYKTEAKHDWGNYELILDVSSFGKYNYVNYAKTKRVLSK
ncbi:MAG: alkaline phosphatase family protein [Sphingobacteriia bacterium]|jgi:predicted AlkP superfamily pyrophosphatase or phosphodiesterase